MLHNGALFCSSHQLALDNIRKGFRVWANAYGSVTREQYLNLLIKNPNSGEWVVEMANYLLERGYLMEL